MMDYKVEVRNKEFALCGSMRAALMVQDGLVAAMRRDRSWFDITIWKRAYDAWVRII